MKRYGFGPEFVPDFKAIKGDTSDNIPGVPGIGDKGAGELIQTFGTIEQMLARWDEIPPKYLKKMEPVKEQMLKSKWLATIECNVPLTYDLGPFVLTQEQLAAAQAMFESLEFRSLQRRARRRWEPISTGLPRVQGEVVAVVEEGGTEKLDIELSERPTTHRWVGSSTTGGTRSSSPPLPRRTSSISRSGRPSSRVGRKAVRASESDALRLIAALPDLAVLHDSKPIYKKIGTTGGPPMEKYASGARMAGDTGGPPVLPPRFDSLLAGYVLLQSGRSQLRVAGSDSKLHRASSPVPSRMRWRARCWCSETQCADRLEHEQQTRVPAKVEAPLIPVLAEMENLGITVDRDQLRGVSKQPRGHDRPDRGKSTRSPAAGIHHRLTQAARRGALRER